MIKRWGKEWQTIDTKIYKEKEFTEKLYELEKKMSLSVHSPIKNSILSLTSAKICVEFKAGV